MLLQYYLEKKKKEINIPARGNCKSKDFRTKVATKCKSKIIFNLLFNDLIEEKGGLMKVNSSSEIPRNRMQISNLNRHAALNKDDLTALILKCMKQSSPENAFIRVVCTAPELYVFLANNWQLNDIRQFCTKEENCSILG